MIRPSFIYFLELHGGNAAKIAEIGVCCGRNAKTMLDAKQNLEAVLVDNYMMASNIPNEGDKKEMLLLLEPYMGRIKFYNTTSVEAAKIFPNNYFDYVYIDACHEYEFVRDDLEAWYPKVKEGGMLAGHDFWYPPVAKAVMEFRDKIKGYMFGVNCYAAPGFRLGTGEADYLDWWMNKYECTPENPLPNKWVNEKSEVKPLES